MVKFNDLNYERVDYEETKQIISNLLEKLDNANNLDNYLDACRKIIKIQSHIEEMADYADIRNMRNSTDEFFKNELDYYDEFKPKFDLLFLPFYKNVINSIYIDELHKVMPDNFFNTIKYKIRISSDDVVALQQKENELKTKYRELNRGLVLYEGKEVPIHYVSSFFSSKDRDVRKKAHDAVNDYYLSKQEEFDNILYELINVRNSIAKSLGFSNYSEYSLYNLRRFGYDYKDIKKFRDSILTYFSPIVSKMDEWKKEELSIDELKYYDTVFFNEMPKPLYNNEELLENLGVSFSNVDEDLYKLYSDMLDKDYIDFIPRKEKLNIGITNYLTETEMPTVTGNFKNTYYDVEVATHEVGHAFQKYCASIKDKDYLVSPLLKYPTFEVAEMFSYAMELIMMDNVSNLFSDEDNNKYGFMKIRGMISTLPYICLVDEFQETIYSKDNLSREDSRKIWNELSKKYGLEIENTGHKNLDDGGYFYRQSHIFMNPFYYIDYALSYFGAFAIWKNSTDNLDFFKEVGGVASYYPLSDLVEKYNLQNPFSNDDVYDISQMLDEELTNRRVLTKKKTK